MPGCTRVSILRPEERALQRFVPRAPGTAGGANRGLLYLRGLVLLCPVLVSCLAGCPASSPSPSAASSQRFAVVFTNKTDSFVSVVFAVTSDSSADHTWLVALGPRTWDSLVLHCDAKTLTAVGALVTSDFSGESSLEVGFSGPALERGKDFSCGAVISVQIDAAPHPTATDPIAAQVKVVSPAQPVGELPLPDSGDGRGFLLVDVAGPAGVAANLNLAWEDAGSIIYQSVLTLSGREPGLSFLVNCPVDRFGLGRFNDAAEPGATLLGSDAQVAPPDALGADDIVCGGTIQVRLVKPGSGGSYSLSLAATQEASEQTLIMYATVREMLDAEGLSDRPSNLLSALPAPSTNSVVP